MNEMFNISSSEQQPSIRAIIWISKTYFSLTSLYNLISLGVTETWENWHDWIDGEFLVW